MQNKLSSLMIRALCALVILVPLFGSSVTLGEEQERPEHVTDKDLLNDVEYSVIFFQLDHAFKEKVILLEKINHEESRKIVGCSIKNNVIALKAYVDLDLPKLLVLADNIESFKNIADNRWSWFKNKSGLFALDCYPLDGYWKELVEGGD